MNRLLSLGLILVWCNFTPAADHLPLKVFILAGQSNMEGQAVSDLEGKDYNSGKGTLNFLLRDATKAPLVKHLRDDSGKWVVRNDVWCRYQPDRGPLLAGPLSMGFSVYGDSHHFGPELQFGHVLGDHFENQVLLIKTAWGGKSLYKDFRPPSSGGNVGPYYAKMLAEIRAALENLKADFPSYDRGGYELAGFVWYHGWNDGVDPKNAVPEYEQNLVHLIQDLRKDLGTPDLPVVVGELTGPWVEAPGAWDTLRQAQAKVAARPEFKDTVLFVPTHDFVRKPEDSPNPTHGHHEFGNAETYFLVGDALAQGMKELLPAAPAKVGWRAGRVLDAAEAHQAAAADEEFFYAITNAQVAKYDRESGQRVAVSNGAAKHLNSGFLWQGKLYCAHSNFPATPERSEIKVLDLESMELSTFKDFGNFGGSLTWAVRDKDHWWCNFARYGEENAQTQLVKFGAHWEEQGRWTYPGTVIRELGHNRLSGGIWREGELLVTGHDDPVVFRLQLPKAGTVLELMGKQSVPFTGQGIAHDPVTGGLVGINRAGRQVMVASLEDAKP